MGTPDPIKSKKLHFPKLKMEDSRHLEKSKNRHISATDLSAVAS